MSANNDETASWPNDESEDDQLIDSSDDESVDLKDDESCIICHNSLCIGEIWSCSDCSVNFCGGCVKGYKDKFMECP